MHSKVVWAHEDPIQIVRQLAWKDWAHSFDIDGEAPVPPLIDALYGYMTSEEHQAFAPHNNNITDPYYCDSESGRKVDLKTAIR